MTLIEAIRIARNEWEWLAIDSSNDICAYDCKPIRGDVIEGEPDMWIVDQGEFKVIGQHTGTPIPWKKSLIKLTDIKC